MSHACHVPDAMYHPRVALYVPCTPCPRRHVPPQSGPLCSIHAMSQTPCTTPEWPSMFHARHVPDAMYHPRVALYVPCTPCPRRHVPPQSGPLCSIHAMSQTPCTTPEWHSMFHACHVPDAMYHPRVALYVPCMPCPRRHVPPQSGPLCSMHAMSQTPCTTPEWHSMFHACHVPDAMYHPRVALYVPCMPCPRRHVPPQSGPLCSMHAMSQTPCTTPEWPSMFHACHVPDAMYHPRVALYVPCMPCPRRHVPPQSGPLCSMHAMSQTPCTTPEWPSMFHARHVPDAMYHPRVALYVPCMPCPRRHVPPQSGPLCSMHAMSQTPCTTPEWPSMFHACHVPDAMYHPRAALYVPCTPCPRRHVPPQSGPLCSMHAMSQTVSGGFPPGVFPPALSHRTFPPRPLPPRSSSHPVISHPCHYPPSPSPPPPRILYTIKNSGIHIIKRRINSQLLDFPKKVLQKEQALNEIQITQMAGQQAPPQRRQYCESGQRILCTYI